MAEIINIKTKSDSRGSLSVIEEFKDIPFDIKRIFYIYDLNENTIRGGHAHKKTRMGMMSLSGSCTVVIDQNGSMKEFVLDKPDKCLLLEPEDWHEMKNFKKNTVLLVLASEYYDPDDYIYDKENIKTI